MWCPRAVCAQWRTRPRRSKEIALQALGGARDDRGPSGNDAVRRQSAHGGYAVLPTQVVTQAEAAEKLNFGTGGNGVAVRDRSRAQGLGKPAPVPIYGPAQQKGRGENRPFVLHAPVRPVELG
jgi:hypothetical protein